MTTPPAAGYERRMPTAFESLSRLPLFSRLSGRQVRKIAKRTNEHHFEADEVIVRQGGKTRSLYVILEGEAKIVRDGRTIARRRPGDFFGEISMIDLRPRVASVVADSSMRCLVLPHEALRDLVISDPGVAWSLLQTVASRLWED